MNRLEYENLLIKKDTKYVLLGKFLINQENRTLLYGYTSIHDSFDHTTWHVYLYDGKIYIYEYDFHNYELSFLSEDNIKTNHDFISPNSTTRFLKRFYPEACDYKFCSILKKLNNHITFTTYNEKRDLTKKFHGLLHPSHQEYRICF